MVVEFIAASGAVFAGFKTYRKQNKAQLYRVLSPSHSQNNGFDSSPDMDNVNSNEAKTTLPFESESSRSKDVTGTIFSAFTDLRGVVENIREKGFRLFDETARRRQLNALTSNPGNAEISQAEIKARRHLLIASGSLVFAVGGAVLLSPLYVISAVCLLSLFRYVFRLAYRSLVHERRFDMNVLTIVMMSAALLGGLLLAAAIAMWFASLNEYLVVKTEDHSKKRLVDLFGEQPHTIWVLLDGVEVEVPFEDIQVGDIVIVNGGLPMPIDGTITAGIASIDQHMLTGEAQPVEKTPGDPVFATTIVLSGKLYVEVKHTGQETVAAKIGKVLEQTTDYRESIQNRWIASLERYMVPMLALGALAFPIAGLSGTLAVLWYYPGYRMIVFGPLSMLSFLHVAAQRGILIKDGRSLELLSDIDTIVFDKTGTLTLEQPHVGAIYPCNDWTEEELLVYAAAAEHRQTHPIARAILAAAQDRNLELPTIEDARYEIGYGIKVFLQGHVVRVGSDRFMNIEDIPVPTEIRQQQEYCHAQGHSLVMVAIDDDLAGAIELRPTVRPEAKHIIELLHQRKLELIIISGDHDAPTRRLAEELGIDRYFAEVLPQDKAELVAQLQQDGRSVCFVGDGINDAIALKQANVSISLRGATTVAIDTAQIVLMDESIGQLGSLFEIIEDYDANMRFNLQASTLPSLVGIACTFLFGWGFLAAGILVQVTTPVALYNTIRPLLDPLLQQQEDPSDSEFTPEESA